MFIEMKHVLILHLLYTALCYTTATIEATNFLLYRYNFNSAQGNIGDAVQCISDYAFEIVTNFKSDKICNDVLFKMCDETTFVGYNLKH